MRRRQVRASGGPGGPLAGHDGLGPLRSVRPDLPSRQLRVRSVGRRQQLGEGSLHGGRRARGLGTGRGAQGVGELRLPAGLPDDTLARWLAQSSCL